MQIALEEGRAAVRLARDILEAHVNGLDLPPNNTGELLAEKRGVFVTLNKEESGVRRLRGCIGYPEPIKPLGEAIRQVTIYASEDPRFPNPVVSQELDKIMVEVSILTLPQDLIASRRQNLPSKVRIGIDGLLISNSYTSGLFLPQVATEQGWDQETYLSEACAKAGLPMDAWLEDGTRVQVFQAEVFAESEPRGTVIRVNPGS